MPDSLTHSNANEHVTVVDTAAHHTPAVADSIARNYPMPDTAALATWAAVSKARMERQQADSAAYIASLPAPWTYGIKPDKLPVSLTSQSVLSALIVSMLVVVLLCMRHGRRLFGTLCREVVSLRNRAKEFDEHTAGESRIMALLGVQLTVYLGLLLLALAMHVDGVPDSGGALLMLTAILMAVAGAYYIFQLVAYWAVGYAFTTDELCRQWLRGFNASQALLGFALAFPALVTVFFPDAAVIALIFAAVCYLCARVAFIYKGFRIFYLNLGSLLLFILYLCALEIIPVFAILSFTVELGARQM